MHYASVATMLDPKTNFYGISSNVENLKVLNVAEQLQINVAGSDKAVWIEGWACFSQSRA